MAERLLRVKDDEQIGKKLNKKKVGLSYPETASRLCILLADCPLTDGLIDRIGKRLSCQGIVP